MTISKNIKIYILQKISLLTIILLIITISGFCIGFIKPINAQELEKENNGLSVDHKMNHQHSASHSKKMPKNTTSDKNKSCCSKDSHFFQYTFPSVENNTLSFILISIPVDFIPEVSFINHPLVLNSSPPNINLVGTTIIKE